MIYRFEARDSGERCRIRTRYIAGTIATGTIGELEDSCSESGPTLAIKIRGTFEIVKSISIELFSRTSSAKVIDREDQAANIFEMVVE